MGASRAAPGAPLVYAQAAGNIAAQLRHGDAQKAAAAFSQAAHVVQRVDRHADAAHEIAVELRAAGLRVVVDDRNESVPRKIRETELDKQPLMAVIGEAMTDVFKPLLQQQIA